MSRLGVGQLLRDVEVGPPANGGHFVCRHEGQVIFVRNAIPGEVVTIRITQAQRRFARAEVVAVQEPSPHRVEAPCAIAGACGGCDFQHVEPSHARELKRQVVQELLAHQADWDFTGEVVAVAPTPLGWRTRMRYHLDQDGRPGLHGHRDSRVVPLPEAGCLIAAAPISRPAADPGRPDSELLGVAHTFGADFVSPNTSWPVTQTVGGRSFEVAANGFWQAHTAAAELLVQRVLAALEPAESDRVLDLYCGVGLFAAALDQHGAQVWGIEANRQAADLARRNAPRARFITGDVARSLSRTPRRVDLVVLDPPRSGAGPVAVEAILAKRPRRIGYVSCDAATLGRDLSQFAELGYRTLTVEAFDLFPMTHHVELFAVLEPADD